MSKLVDMLKRSAEADKAKALLTLDLLENHPAGIGDHSTGDLHDNLNEALSQLDDADSRLDTLRKYYLELGGNWYSEE